MEIKAIVIDENYPRNGNYLSDAFVHVRVKSYCFSELVVVSKGSARISEYYEGVQIELFQSVEEIEIFVNGFCPDIMLIHFYNSWMYSLVTKFKSVIWVHGYEALGWYRRIFNFNIFSKVFLQYALDNTKQQINLRKIIKYSNQTGNLHFVFVSNWMKKITEMDTFCRINFFSIIPNPIDTDLFSFNDNLNNKRILVLRAFHSKKYANDIIVDAIYELSKTTFFHELEFKIIGDGSLFDSLTSKIQHFQNVSIVRGSIEHKSIPSVHKDFGIFLCPTRQDAQGVSMCEAMSSGLVPVSSRNTAIPEFLDVQSGYLTNNSVKEIVKAITELYSNERLFKNKSYNSSVKIRNKCSLLIVRQQEMDLIKRVIHFVK